MLQSPTPPHDAQTDGSGPGGFIRRLWIGIAVLNLLVAGFATHTIYSSWNIPVERANVATRNLSLSLERELAGILDSVDLVLRDLADEYPEHLPSGQLQADHWNLELRKHRSYLPMFAGLRGTDARGAVKFGLDNNDPRNVSVADRPYFVTHRDNPHAGLVISQPVFSRITGMWSLVLSRRVNQHDGAFDGIVAATIPLERFSERFASLKLGENGSVAMRDGDLRLIVRYPELPDGGKIGSTTVSDDFTTALRSDRAAGTYRTGASSIDGVRRFHGYRHNAAYGFYVNVGIDEDEYVAPWRADLIRTLALAGLFLLVTLLFASRLQRAWLRQQAVAAQLRRSEADFRVLAEDSPYGILLLNADGTLAYLNPAFTQMLGYTPADIPNVAIWLQKAYPDPAYRQTVKDAWRQLALQAASTGPVERSFQVCRSDGASREIRFMVVRMEGGRSAITLDDISERLRAEASLRAERDKSRLYLETVQSIMVALDIEGNITMINRFGCAVLGYEAQDLIGRNWFATCLPQPEGSEQVLRYFRRLMSGEAQNQEYFENRVSTADGRQILVAWHNALLHDDDGRIVGTLGAGEDISARRAAEEEIHSLAFFDPLTGLPNRRLVIDRVRQCMVASTRNKKHSALLFLDLDHFKTLNDTRGHDVGDQLLVETANRLRACVRQGDTVSRLGGDEFIVLLAHLSMDIDEAAAQTDTVAEKIVERLGEPCELGNEHYCGTTSVGIAVFVGEDLSVEEILKRADLAMYQAKSAGRNTLRFFDPSMQSRITDRAAMERELNHALGHDELALHYQPQVDAAGRCIGVEALIRWNSPQRGMVSPLEFISLAEETGQILPIGQWVLNQACKRLTEWSANPVTADLVVAVNVSAKQIKQPDFVAGVRAALTATGANPALLKLEITESVLVENIEDIIDKMSALKQIGISFSLDDFGTGYSSLSYVKRLPLDQLKIDQSFVRDIAIDPNDAAICRAIIALGKTLGLSIVAEGVETEQQWQLLTDQGCPLAQGYLFARPIPAQGLMDWLNGRGAG